MNNEEPAATSARRERASIAVDLGAESCRVSLLRWVNDVPQITLVHRFANAPYSSGEGLRWPLQTVVDGVDAGVLRCADAAPEGIRSIAVDGWAVDYVRLHEDGTPVDDPFCYRDPRTIEAQQHLHLSLPAEHLRELTGVEPSRINTIYQLYADQLSHRAEGTPWLNLPEYMLTRWGAAPFAEYTNASHTQMLAFREAKWSGQILSLLEQSSKVPSRILPPGTRLGRMRGRLAEHPALSEVELIAPACHDTASAIAGIGAAGDDWAYISAGTWSLVGTLLKEGCNHAASRRHRFTNLAAVGGAVAFQTSLNGMWLLQQCLSAWSSHGYQWTAADMVTFAAEAEETAYLLDVNDPDLILPGNMPDRIDTQLHRRGLGRLDPSPQGAPKMANLILRSLAAAYAQAIDRLESLTSKKIGRVYLVGGASRNSYLLRLCRSSIGREVVAGSAESSTVGNFAVQLATLAHPEASTEGADAAEVQRWASILRTAVLD